MKQLGKYELLEKLGQGGYGTVYRAQDPVLNVERAVKVLHPNLINTPEFIERFQREARHAARMEHPNIVPVYELAEEAGYHYLVMKYVPGGSLKQLLVESGSLPFERSLDILRQVASALEYAHKLPEKLVHRDIKPANILFDADGTVRLSDFGFAKALDDAGDTSLSISGSLIGTPAYMAPEAWRAQPVSPATDVYSLGCVLYEMLTVKLLFDGGSPADMMTKHIIDGAQFPKVWPAGVPEGLKKVLKKTLAKNPADRYQSMGEFVVALEKLVQGKSFAPSKVQSKRIIEKKTPQEKSPVSKPAFPMQYLWFTLGGLALVSILMGWLLGGGAAEAFPAKTPTYTLTSIATSPPALGIGSTWERPIDGMKMLYIPAGAFQMGSNDGQSDEKPIHSVFLDAYWMDETEVTNGMYAKCVSAGECDNSGGMYSSYAKDANHPVEDVNWYDAQNYCHWAGGKLPTEAEWEKAARGGLEGKEYPWGNESPSCQQGVEYGAQRDTCIGKTVRIGSFSANGYGLYDMSGNVWEWVFDWYKDDYYVKSPNNNPQGPSLGDYRVLRGGSWYLDNYTLRNADRYRGYPSNTYSTYGFRCSRSP